MKVWLRTFGCRANHADSERVRAMVLAAGGSLVADAAEADVAVFNSCAVTAEAEADLRQSVRRAAREQPALRSVVMGCAAALDTGPLRALPGVDRVIGGADFAALADALGIPADAPMSASQTGTRALLRIQDGCDEHCTFCATTLARGAHRSRPAAALVAEGRALAAHHPEIVLTGVHIGAWGREWGTTLGDLMTSLAAALPATRFRLTSVEASEVDDRLAGLLRDGAPAVAPHLHAPLQSGSDAVLKRMGRHWYTAATYARAVERLAAGLRSFALGADLIAGFPGETDADHAATVALVRDLPFTYLHVFPFSPRPGTAAMRLGPAVSPPVIAARAAELRALGAAKGAAHRAARGGTVADVVVTGTGARRAGLTEDYLKVVVTDPALGRGVRADCRLTAGDGAGTLIAVPLSRIVE